MGSHLWRKVGKNVIYDKARVNGETNYDYSSIYIKYMEILVVMIKDMRTKKSKKGKA